MKVKTDTEGPQNRNFNETGIASTSAAAQRQDNFSVTASE
jgi:hypothetical protein